MTRAERAIKDCIACSVDKRMDHVATHIFVSGISPTLLENNIEHVWSRVGEHSFYLLQTNRRFYLSRNSYKQQPHARSISFIIDNLATSKRLMPVKHLHWTWITYKIWYNFTLWMEIFSLRKERLGKNEKDNNNPFDGDYLWCNLSQNEELFGWFSQF